MNKIKLRFLISIAIASPSIASQINLNESNSLIDDALIQGDYRLIKSIEEIYQEIINITDTSNNSIFQSAKNLATRQMYGDYNFAVKDCPNVKTYECEIDNFNEEFFDDLNVLQQHIRGLHENSIRVFDHSTEYKLEKLLILLGDYLRSEVAFPMSTQTTPNQEFLSALLADALSYDLRTLNYPQKDLGINQSNYQLAEIGEQHFTGYSRQNGVPLQAYAIPGETVSVTNNGDTAVSIVLGRHMWQSTLPFYKNDYRRPSDYALQASWSNNADENIRRIIVQPKQRTTFTSSFGGNLWAVVPSGTHGTPLDLSLSNIGLGSHVNIHSTEQEKTRFKKALDEGVYTYYVISGNNSNDSYHHTMFEASFNGEPLDKVLEDFDWFDRFYPTYGFRYGEGTQELDDIQGFIRERNLSMDGRLVYGVQRSSYPTNFTNYSTSSFVDPVGSRYGLFAPMRHSPASIKNPSTPYAHVNLHEKGHIIQANESQFEPWFSKKHTESTVNIIAWSMTLDYNQRHHNNLDFTLARCWSGMDYQPFKDALLKAAHTENPDQAMREHWQDKGSSYYRGQYNIFLQTMIAADRTEGSTAAFNTLWQRVVIMNRNIEKVLHNDDHSHWYEISHALGFSGYSLEELRDMNINDRLLILLASASNLDYSEQLSMLGIVLSDNAIQHVGSFGYNRVERVLWEADDCAWSTPPLFTSGLEAIDPTDIPIIPDAYDGTLAYITKELNHQDAVELCLNQGFTLAMNSDFAAWRKMYLPDEHATFGLIHNRYWTNEPPSSSDGQIPWRRFTDSSGSRSNPDALNGVVCRVNN